tara:strand:- start:193 stop:357 length:165 start_codon:yes stop_codon:yes gene_type:complete
MSLDKIILKLEDVLAKAKKKPPINLGSRNSQLRKDLFLEINKLLEKVIERLEKK